MRKHQILVLTGQEAKLNHSAVRYAGKIQQGMRNANNNVQDRKGNEKQLNLTNQHRQ